MGAFFFGTTAKMQEQVSKLIGTKVVIINCLDVPFMDLSGYFALSEMIDRLQYEKIKPIVVVNEGIGIRQQMVAMGYGDLLGPDGIQTDYNDALHLTWEYLHNDSYWKIRIGLALLNDDIDKKAYCPFTGVRKIGILL